MRFYSSLLFEIQVLGNLIITLILQMRKQKSREGHGLLAIEPGTNLSFLPFYLRGYYPTSFEIS